LSLGTDRSIVGLFPQGVEDNIAFRPAKAQVAEWTLGDAGAFCISRTNERTA
jgi:hypothetical protein